MAKRFIRIHGDNIIECERSLSLLSKSLNVTPCYLEDSRTFMPKYMLGEMQVDLLPGHGRWGIDLADILAKHGGVLREYADSYVTEIKDGVETIVFALEYCSALPAGNNAWQRNGRAFSSALAGVPYLYLAEIGGVELDDERHVKAPRFPNPVVPFSYLMTSKRLDGFCLPVYFAHPSITDALFEEFSDVFGMNECLQIIEALLNGKDCTAIASALTEKALKMVKLLAGRRRFVDTLRGNEWDTLLKSKNCAQWLQNNFKELKWKKKTADKVLTTSSFDRLFAKVLDYNCLTIGARDLPVCMIPEDKRLDFMSFLKTSYPSLQFSFHESNPLAIVWITGFKPHGDDSRPDRGLSPLAKMILGNDAQIMAVVYGPAKESTWDTLQESVEVLAKDNGLWQSLFAMCDYVLVDSATCGEKLLYQTGARLTQNVGLTSFKYVNPTVTYSEHDTDTTIHQLFSHKERFGVFECLCNPPGGDWSGISCYVSADEEYRWTSLPRVSAIGGKRPDHIIQVRGKNKDVFFSIESKLRGRDLETNIGTNLRTYIEDLFQNLPTAFRMANHDWRLFEGQRVPMRNYKIVSVGAYAFESVDEMSRQMIRGRLDVVFAFDFNETTTMHVLYNINGKEIVNVLKKVQLGLNRLKIQIH